MTSRAEGLPALQIWGYSSGNFGLSAGLVAWALLLARLFDSITDPVMGYLWDRTNSR
ncbi:MAG: Na+/melibiose symporter-like transporter [Patiriisocius sp.]|jgi:Na+/melibiose symporter-like transporter